MAAVSEGVEPILTTEGVVFAAASKGIRIAAIPKGVGVARIPEGVGVAVFSEETVIIKKLFTRTYILLNNIRIIVIRYVQRHIRKRSS